MSVEDLSAEREMIASDLGYVEQTCQSGLGDPPMDCGWPECECGVLRIPFIQVAPSELTALRSCVEGLERALMQSQIALDDAEVVIDADDCVETFQSIQLARKVVRNALAKEK